MLNENDLEIIYTILESSIDADSAKPEDLLVKHKVAILIDQMKLQSEFRNRSLELQNKMKEIEDKK